MTKLRRPVRREVASLHHGPLVVTLTEEGLYLREKGRRTAYLMPYGTAYQQAVQLKVQHDRQERKRQRGRGR